MKNKYDLNNQIAIVTGASSGLGRQISIKLAENDFYVILASRSISGLEETHRLIKENNGESIYIKLDITVVKSIKLFKKEVDKIGSPNVIVNNAGIGIFNKIEDTKKNPLIIKDKKFYGCLGICWDYVE